MPVYHIQKVNIFFHDVLMIGKGRCDEYTSRYISNVFINLPLKNLSSHIFLKSSNYSLVGLFEYLFMFWLHRHYLLVLAKQALNSK